MVLGLCWDSAGTVPGGWWDSWGGPGRAGRWQRQEERAPSGVGGRQGRAGEAGKGGATALAPPTPSGERPGDTLCPGPGFPRAGSNPAAAAEGRCGEGLACGSRARALRPALPGLLSRPPLSMLSGKAGLPRSCRAAAFKKRPHPASLACKNQYLSQSSKRRPITSTASGFSAAAPNTPCGFLLRFCFFLFPLLETPVLRLGSARVGHLERHHRRFPLQLSHGPKCSG